MTAFSEAQLQTFAPMCCESGLPFVRKFGYVHQADQTLVALPSIHRERHQWRDLSQIVGGHGAHILPGIDSLPVAI